MYVVNDFPHLSQVYCLTPVCVLSCTRRVGDWIAYMISPSYHKCWRNQAFKVVTFSIFTAKLKAPPNGSLRHTGGCRENDQCRPRIFFSNQCSGHGPFSTV